MRKVFLIKILLLLILAVSGQELSEKNRNLTLKLPLSFLAGDIYAESMGIGVGLEKMVKPSLSISQEVGYIFHINQTSMLNEDVENINGIKLSTEIRKYLSKKEIPESGFFANLEMKNILTKSMQFESDMIENEIIRYRGVLTANFGTLFYWDKNKKSKITLELLAGGGLGYVYANSSLDVESMGNATDYNSTNEFYPWLNFDIKIGFVLK